VLDGKNPINMKNLLDCGALTKCRYGVKILGGGSEKIKALGYPVTLEVSDATI
jgi:hypothetical protein